MTPSSPIETMSAAVEHPDLILGGLFAYQRHKGRALEADRERFESLVAERTIS